MTQIDFYILQKSDDDSRLHFICRLTEKALSRGHRVMVATESAEQTKKLDELLWQFRPESFVPHTTAQDGLPAPVFISHEQDDRDHHQVLINLREEIPQQFSRFERLLEVVIQAPQVLQSTRQHYAFYKARGYQLNSHKL